MILPESKPEELADAGDEQSKELAPEANEQSEGTQGAGDQAGEQSAESFDPSSLTPELQKVYKNMEKAYTKKTQAVADSKKSLEEKEQKLEELRLKYEDKILVASQPKGEETLVDTSQMTPEQEKAWNLLNKHFDKKLDKLLGEKERVYKEEISQLRSYVGQREWKDFSRNFTDADTYRPKMIELQKTIGGNPSLEQLYLLAKGSKEMKQAGVEEYKRSVQTKKNVVTSKPTSTAGEETEIEFEKGQGANPQRRRVNILKAWTKSREELDAGKLRR